MEPISMVKALSVLSLLGVVGLMTKAAAGVPDLLGGVEHLHHAAIRIADSQIVYFDPFQLKIAPHDADLIFITHPHSDHFSLVDIKKAAHSQTILVLPADAAAQAESTGLQQIIAVPGQMYESGGISFQTIPAYNLNKTFHPQENQWVGYIVTLHGVRYYVAGDTDLIPEMRRIEADVAFLPVGGTYTMTATEAANAANLIQPALAVPIHFGSVVGSQGDAQGFVHALRPGIQGRILLDE